MKKIVLSGIVILLTNVNLTAKPCEELAYDEINNEGVKEICFDNKYLGVNKESLVYVEATYKGKTYYPHDFLLQQPFRKFVKYKIEIVNDSPRGLMSEAIAKSDLYDNSWNTLYGKIDLSGSASTRVRKISTSMSWSALMMNVDKQIYKNNIFNKDILTEITLANAIYAFNRIRRADFIKAIGEKELNRLMDYGFMKWYILELPISKLEHPVEFVNLYNKFTQTDRTAIISILLDSEYRKKIINSFKWRKSYEKEIRKAIEYKLLPKNQ